MGKILKLVLLLFIVSCSTSKNSSKTSDNNISKSKTLTKTNDKVVDKNKNPDVNKEFRVLDQQNKKNTMLADSVVIKNSDSELKGNN